MDSSTRDVIVIGGGLSGLSAAYQLEQQGVAYTLIEVKPRLGGSVFTFERSGFVMDGGPFAFRALELWPTIDELGLAESLFTVRTTAESDWLALSGGTESLVTTIAGRLTGPIIRRMAVTGIGPDEASGGYRICLENGLNLTARAVIVAVPAPSAERIFRTMAPAISETLQGYYYDSVTQVALGYLPGNHPAKAPTPPPDMVFASLLTTTQAGRVPGGGLLIQAGVRVQPGKIDGEALVASILQTMHLPPPDAQITHEWPYSHPLTVTGPPRGLAELNDHLPPTVALIGSCYMPLPLPHRMEEARAAARRVVASLPN